VAVCPWVAAPLVVHGVAWLQQVKSSAAEHAGAPAASACVREVGVVQGSAAASLAGPWPCEFCRGVSIQGHTHGCCSAVPMHPLLPSPPVLSPECQQGLLWQWQGPVYQEV
jgi:hypothetical protein